MMCRELRKVREDWVHPTDGNGKYIPLKNGCFKDDFKRYELEEYKWRVGYKDDFNGGWILKSDEESCMTFKECYGEKPNMYDYMPQWSENEKTHIQLYETTTEGTPLSPVFLIPEFDALCEFASKNRFIFATFKVSKQRWIDSLQGDLTK